MDRTKAKNLAKRLDGQICLGWEIGEYINNGKSAIVLKAKNAKQVAAIKIFDIELVEKHGAQIQEERINREISLIGKSHSNLVQILGGGFWKEENTFFIAMEYLNWPKEPLIKVEFRAKRGS